MAVGYGKLASVTTQNTKDVKEAREVAEGVRAALILSDNARNSQITALSINVAETKTSVFYMDKKLDELIAQSRTRTTTTR